MTAGWPGVAIRMTQDPHAQADGIVALRSSGDFQKTTERLQTSLSRRSIQLVARIDHAQAARVVGMTMRPTELFVFGNPASGTPLMIEAPSIAIDLPLKILVGEDGAGLCWVTYNDPIWLARRHGLDLPQHKVLRTMRDMLASISIEAAGRGEPT